MPAKILFELHANAFCDVELPDYRMYRDSFESVSSQSASPVKVLSLKALTRNAQNENKKHG